MRDNLLKYSHDRNDSFKKTSDDLFSIVDKFGDQESLCDLYEYYQKKYGLPENIVKQQFKNNIAHFYEYKKGRFSKDLKLKHTLFSMFRFFAILFYSFIHSKKYNQSSKYKLIVDGIATNLQLKRFSKLINLFKKENVLVITDNETVCIDNPEYNCLFLPNCKYYDRLVVNKVIYNELSSGVWKYLRCSIKSRVNLFLLATTVIKSYLFYKSLLKWHYADFIIQERHYQTSAIKNYLFKQNNGLASTTIQKNIIQSDSQYYFADIDWLFSFASRGMERMFDYGGRIDRIIPVGSMFMEFYWFSNPSGDKKIYDVLLLGINMSNSIDRLDSYTEFITDYYNSFHWLVRFKKEFPYYCIAVKHHASAPTTDECEKKILKNSGVKIIDQQANSYKVSFASNCVVTFGSTMGYELNAHGLRTFFIDPGNRCNFLPDIDDDLLGRLRVGTYDVFRDSILEVLETPKLKRSWGINPGDMCLESSTASTLIHDAFVKNIS
jgi:hypothetical protein